MAITGANYAHSAGGANHAELLITVSAASTTLCCFVTKSTEPTVAPVVKDDALDTWTVNTSTKCLFNASGASVWFASKVSKGTEKEIKATGGTITGIAYIELKSTLALEVDTITVRENIASAKTATIEGVSAANGSALMVAVGATGASGALSAWTGTGPVLTQSVTTTGRTWFGWKVLTEALVSKTFTSTWVTEKVTGMVAVALKEKASEVKEVSASLTVSEATAAKAGLEIGAKGSLSVTEGTVGGDSQVQSPIGAIGVVTALTGSPAVAESIVAALGVQVGVGALAGLETGLQTAIGTSVAVVGTAADIQTIGAALGASFVLKAPVIAEGGVTPTKHVAIFIFED